MTPLVCVGVCFLLFLIFFFCPEFCLPVKGERFIHFEEKPEYCLPVRSGFRGGSVVKNPLPSAGDRSSIHGLERSPGEGNDNPLQYSCLENPMDRGAWQAKVHGVEKELDMISEHMLNLSCLLNFLFIIFFLKLLSEALICLTILHLYHTIF